jgi:hypothetical protein
MQMTSSAQPREMRKDVPSGKPPAENSSLITAATEFLGYVYWT